MKNDAGFQEVLPDDGTAGDPGTALGRFGFFLLVLFLLLPVFPGFDGAYLRSLDDPRARAAMTAPEERPAPESKGREPVSERTGTRANALVSKIVLELHAPLGATRLGDGHAASNAWPVRANLSSPAQFLCAVGSGGDAPLATLPVETGEVRTGITPDFLKTLPLFARLQSIGATVEFRRETLKGVSVSILEIRAPRGDSGEDTTAEVRWKLAFLNGDLQDRLYHGTATALLIRTTATPEPGPVEALGPGEFALAIGRLLGVDGPVDGAASLSPVLLGAGTEADLQGLRNAHLFDRYRRIRREIKGTPAGEAALERLRPMFTDPIPATREHVAAADRAGTEALLGRRLAPARGALIGRTLLLAPVAFLLLLPVFMMLRGPDGRAALTLAVFAHTLRLIGKNHPAFASAPDLDAFLQGGAGDPWTEIAIAVVPAVLYLLGTFLSGQFASRAGLETAARTLVRYGVLYLTPLILAFLWFPFRHGGGVPMPPVADAWAHHALSLEIRATALLMLGIVLALLPKAARGPLFSR